MKYVIEVTHPYAPDDSADERWECPDAETAALCFESEAEPSSWSVEQIAAELATMSEVRNPLEYANDERGTFITVTVKP